MSKKAKTASPKKSGTVSRTPADVADADKFIKGSTDRDKKRRAPEDIRTAIEFVGNEDRKTLQEEEGLWENETGGSGELLTDNDSIAGTRLKAAFEAEGKVTCDDIAHAAITYLVEHPEQFEASLCRSPARTQEAVHDITVQVIAQRRRKEILGIDIAGLTRKQAAKRVNAWLSEHSGRMADISNEDKEAIVKTLREIRDELEGRFIFEHRSDPHLPCTLSYDIESKNGKRRFTVISAGTRGGLVSQTQGLPRLTLEIT